MLEVNKIYNADCLELMKKIGDKSIDCILCDLPYGTTACKWDVIIPFEPLWEQYKRILKDDGAVILTASQPFTTDVINSNRKWFKYELIWEKEQGTNQMLKDIMPLKIHENILVFSKNKTLYNPQFSQRNRIITKRKGCLDKITSTELKSVIYDNNGKNYPTSIISAKRELKNRYHPTQKPVALFEYLIKTYTNANDLVLDNCSGSGTTAIACHNLNRNFICIEKDYDYWKASVERLENAQAQCKLF